mmetsp:Transcript_44893/g.100930  ORF Transcript_44893/g.100930 Transcript_44893/m.100930 type:complete len:227 (-) Transcript_44893:697-1377(-)
MDQRLSAFCGQSPFSGFDGSSLAAEWSEPSVEASQASMAPENVLCGGVPPPLAIWLLFLTVAKLRLRVGAYLLVKLSGSWLMSFQIWTKDCDLNGPPRHTLSCSSFMSWRSCVRNVGVFLVESRKSMRRWLFISICIFSPSMSLGSVPNGFSSSTAMRFRDHKVNTWMKENTPAHHAFSHHWDTTKGTMNQCSSSRQSHVCAYGKGNGTLEIFRASWKCTMPFAIS